MYMYSTYICICIDSTYTYINLSFASCGMRHCAFLLLINGNTKISYIIYHTQLYILFN